MYLVDGTLVSGRTPLWMAELHELGRRTAGAEDTYLFGLNDRETVTATGNGLERDFACHICGQPYGH